MKKAFSLFVLLFFLLSSQCFAVSGKKIYENYLANENKMEQSSKNLIIEVETSAENILSHTIIYHQGTKSRTETTIVKAPLNSPAGKKGDKTIVINNGKTTTIFSPIFGKQTTTNEDEEEENQTPSQIDLIKKENVSGIECFKIKLSFSDYDESKILWISASDYILVKQTELSEESYTEINSDFRKVNGFRVPFLTKTYEGDNLMETIQIKSAKTNANISSALFDPDKVTGYKEAAIPQETEDVNSNINKMETIMEMGMQIQKHYQNGEPEKAKALEKKLEEMTNNMN